jgi:pimeloyl-ACP methyl ester carboxylesterase
LRSEALEERVVDVPGARVRVLECPGDSDDTVVFLHGITGSASTWEPYLAALPARLRGIAFDALGCGYTVRAGPRRPITRDDLRRQLAAVADALGVPRFRAVGHSMGCGAPLGLAWREPDRVAGLLLVAPAQLGRRRLGPTLRAARFGPAARLLEWSAPAVVPALAGRRLRAAAGRRADPELRRREAGHALARPRETVRGFVDVAGHTDLRLPSPEAASWSAIAGPAWILRGSDDRDWMPESHEARYRELIPAARVIRWERVGHSPHIEQPERFRALLAEFIAAS